MRRLKLQKINSIGFGPPVLGILAALLTAVPLLCWLIASLFRFYAAFLWMKISLVAGATGLAGFLLLLAVELRQDRRAAAFYDSRRNRGLPLGDGRYECQNCGSRAPARDDRQCPVCHIVFGTDGRKDEKDSDE